MDSTGISWTDRTWNPWRGCTKVSPGCDNCYMFAGQKRWGQNPEVVTRTGVEIWRRPFNWEREAAEFGRVDFVFTCSWSDWFHPAADDWRAEAWEIVRSTPNLVYQILTKRPHLIVDRLPADWGDGYSNVWLGVSVEGNRQRGRVRVLSEIPAYCRFVSYEPALDRLNLIDLSGIHWVIYGGESGPGFRPEGEPGDAKAWAREMFKMCQRGGVAFFHKQSAGPLPGRGVALDGIVLHSLPDQRSK